MMALGRTLSQYDWSCQKRGSEHRHAPSGNYVKTQSKMAIYKPRREPQKKSNTADT